MAISASEKVRNRRAGWPLGMANAPKIATKTDILFVGDTPLDDVLGSKGVGMHSAWIRTRNRELPEGIPAPDIIISNLAELPAALGL